MANKRMFSKQITSSDAFLDMPSSSQLLYFHLNMEADDDGFVSNPKRIMRTLNVAEDDMKILLAKRFLLPFESGVVVIKHWLLHNAVRKDMYKETQYLDEKNTLTIKENGSYTESCNETVTKPLHRIDKIRVDKNRLEQKNSLSFLLEIPETELKGLSELFYATPTEIKRKAEQMHGYCLAKGKKYKDYKAFLRNGLDKDFRRREDVETKNFSRPELEVTPEQKAENTKRLAEMRENIIKKL